MQPRAGDAVASSAIGGTVPDVSAVRSGEFRVDGAVKEIVR
jgi:hypothetical protein